MSAVTVFGVGVMVVEEEERFLSVLLSLEDDVSRMDKTGSSRLAGMDGGIKIKRVRSRVVWVRELLVSRVVV